MPNEQAIRESILQRQRPPGATAALVLADGTVIWGHGVGAAGASVGEVVFNTSMTGYQEVLTDPPMRAR